MKTIVYENSFEGWLSAVFDIYEYRFDNVEMYSNDCYQPNLLGETHFVETSEKKWNRVFNGLKQKQSARALQLLYYCFLSGEEKIANTMLQYIRYAFSSKKNMEYDFSSNTVVDIVKAARRVSHEKCRMEGFIRFQLTKDGLYYAMIEPDHDILPLISHHFEKRFADQQWLIYDAKRKYGLYYNLEDVSRVTLSFNDNSSECGKEIVAEEEELYQKLWKLYFSSINIPARKNTKLHLKVLPKRYWKHLTEKKLEL